MKSAEVPYSQPWLLISVAFVVWKALLGLVAYSCPGVGYDTSSSLLEDYHFSPELKDIPLNLQHALTKFVRWDAIYFTQIAARGYVFEQEWAFSFGYAKIVSTISEVLLKYLSLTELHAITLSGALISHVAHLSSVYVLCLLTRAIHPEPVHGERVALGAALLHIVSPAGIFLSSPYAESLFSFLNISGFALYVCGMNRRHGHATISQRFQVVTAGLLFGAATILRSNGILSGLPFLYDAVARTWAIINHGFSRRRLYDMASLISGGLLVASGLVIPQTVAYHIYCKDVATGAKQPWCTRTIPSIYAWVQEHYWVNGLFSYWTVSNIPLFLIAAPMLLIVSYSAFRALWPDKSLAHTTSSGNQIAVKVDKLDEGALVRLALPQLVLAILVLFFNNVQIITRLSSGYPLWYIWLAKQIFNSDDFGQKDKSFVKSVHLIRFMVMYAVIQGGLYAAFLPPA